MEEKKSFDILSTGELLVDFIGQKMGEDLEVSKTYDKFQGGSPANLAANIRKLGGRSAVVATVGNDGLGRYLITELDRQGVYTGYITKHPTLPTSIIMIAKTTRSPEFIPYRYADNHIEPAHFPDFLLRQCKVFHTTAFGLSKKPAQDSILHAAGRAHKFGAVLSIDMNYAVQIFPEIDTAKDVLRRYFQYAPLVKLSGDDAGRLYGKEAQNPRRVIKKLLAQGARLVCLTDGPAGNYVATPENPDADFFPALKLDVKDSTGAGDAFWGGFLYAWIKGSCLVDCQQMAEAVVKLKLSNVGPLPAHIDVEALLAEHKSSLP